MRARISPPCPPKPSARFTLPDMRCASSTAGGRCASMTMARRCRLRCGRSMPRRSSASVRCPRWSNGTPQSRRSRSSSAKPRRRRFSSDAPRRERALPSLREVQRAIRASLVERDDAAAAACILGDGLAPQQRLAVYRNTFASSLASALRLSFPAVECLVGAEFFDNAARIFAHERAPASANLDDYGSEFPDFLARFRPAASLVYLSDVARLEWAVTRALHASDVEALDANRLTEVEHDDRGRVRFVPHPSVSLMRSDYPVDAIWCAVLAQDDA